MKNLFYIRLFGFLFFTLAISIYAAADKLVWPSPPDEPRIEYVGEIVCKDLQTGSSFFAKIKKFLSGRSDTDIISLPYDVIVIKNKMYLTCQGIPYLIEINMTNNSYKTYSDKENPFSFPVSLCQGNDEIIFITDSENRTVYKFEKGKIKPFITEGLSRPTGIAAHAEKKLLYVIDTGEHDLKIFDFKGNLIKAVSNDLATEEKFHFPTYVSITDDNYVLVNDALNYKIKRFDLGGNFISSFGDERDGPGTFSRPKGVATDSEGNIYVIDNLFDNLQVFDSTGHILLVVGAVGNQKGQFYSPSGLAINNDTVYIADTFNNRIQILHYLGDNNDN